MKTIPTSNEFYSDTRNFAKEHGISDLQKEECSQFHLAYTMFLVKAGIFYDDESMAFCIDDLFSCFRHGGGFYFICHLGFSSEESEELLAIKESDPEYYQDLQEIFEETAEMSTGLSEDERIMAAKEIMSWKSTCEKLLKTPCFFQYLKPDSENESICFHWCQKDYRKNSAYHFKEK